MFKENLTNMTATATEYRNLQIEIKELEAQLDALKQVMIKELDLQQVDSLQAGPFTVRHSLVESRRVDTNALKQAGLYDDFSKVTHYLKFQVS